MSDIDLQIEIKKGIEESIKLSRDTQEQVRLSGENQDCFQKETIDKMAIAATKSAEHLQKLSAQIKEISAASLRPSTNGKLGLSQEEINFSCAINKYLRYGNQLDRSLVDDRIKQYTDSITFGDEKMSLKFANELVSGIDPAGGYFILPDRSSRILTRFFETSPIRQVSAADTTTSARVEYPIDDNEASSGGWVGEVDDRSATTASPDVGMLIIDPLEQFAQPIASANQLADAAFDVEAWLSRKIGSKLSRVENTAFVTGSGNTQPKGFMNESIYPAWAVNTSANGGTQGVYERGKLETLTTESAGVIGLDDLTNLQGTLLAPYQANATWMMNRLTYTQLLKIKTTQDLPLISATYLPGGAPTLTILGDPVMFASDVALITTNALSIAYGDFREGYTVLDRAGIFVLRDNLTTKGKVKFYTTKRVGGGVTSFDALKRLKIQ